MPEPPDHGRRRRRRLIWWVLGGALVLGLVAVVATVGLLIFYGERSIERVEVEGIDSSDQESEDSDVDVDEIDDVLNVLVVGSDRREGLSEEEQQELGTGEIGGDRTDTIMLMRLDPSTEEVAMLSFPRDLLVSRCDGSRGKINAAYHIGERSDVGGPSCLVQTITEMSGLPVHHFVEVDFAGFLELVDIVDGVTVYLEEAIDDPLAKLDLEAGCHQLSGVEALGFVRHRASDSDYGRIARQQRFIKELVREASSVGSLLNVPRLFQMVETGASAVTTDESLTLDKMRRIAFTLRDLDNEHLAARTVPADYERIDGIDFEVPREDEADRLFRAFEQGRLGDEPPPADEDEQEGDDDEEEEPGGQLAPADVPALRLLNGSGIDGLAASFSDALGQQGFAIHALGNVDGAPRSGVLVRYPPDLADEAAVVADHIADAELEEAPGYGTIELVLGAEADPEKVMPGAGPPDDDGADDEGADDEAADNGGSDNGGADDDTADGGGADGGGPDDGETADGEGDEGATPPPEDDREFIGAQPPPERCY